MRLICGCFVLLVACSFPTFSQQTYSSQQREISYDLWRVRSQTITEDLLKDAADFSPSGRAVLWTRLAQRWWWDDPEKARSWLLKSIEVVEAVPNKENPSERSQRLATTRLLLRIVTPLDQKLSARLVAVLSDDAEHMADPERGANADGLIEAAISIVERDPVRAVELGVLALRMGHTSAWLISSLRSKNARLGDSLLAQTMEAARQTLDTGLIISLSRMIFLDSMQPGAPKPALPDEMRTELLKLDLAFLQANPINLQNRDSVCANVSYFIVPVMVHFERLLPQQAAIARQAANGCQSSYPPARQHMEDALRGQSLDTVDALLKAGDEAHDLKVQTVYHYRAAALAKEQNDLDRALKILDSMSPAEREFAGGSWEAYRWDWAALAALRHFKSGDVYGMRLIINAAPADLQLYVKLAFVRQLPDKRDKDIDPTLEFLGDVRAGLPRSSLSDAEKSAGYVSLLPLVIKFQPTDATAVLKEMVAAINRAEQANDKNTGNNGNNSLSGSEFLRNLPASLLEMDEYTVKEAVASINSSSTRAEVRLELLGGCIQRMRSSKKGSPNAPSAVSRGE